MKTLKNLRWLLAGIFVAFTAFSATATPLTDDIRALNAANKAAVDAKLSAIDALPASALPAIVISPKPNEVLQKTCVASVCSAEVRVAWRGTATLARLKQGSTVISESAAGNFGAIPPGWYEIVLVTAGVEGDRIKMGVGDVFGVAGQSNSVSPVQPHGFIMPVPAEGKVILSDYYRFGHYTFRDPGVDPLVVDAANGVYQAGAGWLYAGLALNRPYPVMFVIIGQGNSSTTLWTTTYGQRLPEMWARHKPRAILWHQGESDAAEGISQATTFANMDAIVLGLKHQTVTPWIVALNSTNGGYAPVRAAQQQLIDKWYHIFQGPDTDLLRVSSGPEVEFLAVSPVGNQLQGFGSAWAAAIVAAGL